MTEKTKEKTLLFWQAAVTGKSEERVYLGLPRWVKSTDINKTGRHVRERDPRTMVGDGLFRFYIGYFPGSGWDEKNYEGLVIRTPIQSIYRLIAGAGYGSSKDKKEMIRVLQRTRDELIRQEASSNGEGDV